MPKQFFSLQPSSPSFNMEMTLRMMPVGGGTEDAKILLLFPFLLLLLPLPLQETPTYFFR